MLRKYGLLQPIDNLKLILMPTKIPKFNFEIPNFEDAAVNLTQDQEITIKFVYL